MEYDQDGSMSPFWQQTTTAFRRAGHRRRSLPSNLFFNFPFLIILLLASAIFFIFFVIPSVVSFTSQIFRPTSVRKSWDSLNLVLVLFAIICGFLSRTNTDNPITPRDPSNASHGLQRSNSTPRQWYGYSDRGPPQAAAYGRLRSSSSYPDLRQESQWVSTDESWRFFDDTHVNNYRFSDPDYLHRRRRTSEIEVEETTQTKNIPVDTFVMRPPDRPPSPSPPPPLTPPPPPPAATPPPPPPPPSTTIKRNAKRTHQALAHEEKLEHKKSEPPPIAAASSPPHSEEKYVKSDKKRGGATKEFLTSLYQQRKRKKKRKQKSVDNFDDILHQQTPSSVHLYPPPPPPMPPPPSVFQNLFSTKKSKNKKIHSTPPPPPPPPPPPAASTPRVSKTKTQIANPVTTRKPPLPVKSNSFKRVEEYTGNESPLIPMPPPPPPPPFKMPGWKFVVQGDYVRIKSNSSSRSGSPDLDDVSEPSSPAMGGGDSPAPSQPTVFCPPSPDVNTKADNFIARFRAELKLEKVNSIKKQGLSNLGPEPSPRRSPSLGQI